MRVVDFILIFVVISYEIIPDDLNEYLDLIESHRHPQSQIIVVGAKSDIKKWRMNPEDELEFLIKDKYPYVEVSAKENDDCLSPLFHILCSQEEYVIPQQQPQYQSHQSTCFLL